MQALYDNRAGTEMKKADYNKLFLQPLNDIYLKSSMPNEISPNSNIRYLYIWAPSPCYPHHCINFMNLSTARSEKRAREVGVRKVLGAERGSLVRQFLGESMLHACIALAIALFLVYALLPYFNNLAQTEIKIFDSPLRTAWIGALTLITGLLAGLYPALYLSSFRPVKVLKGKIINSFSALAIRKGLVIFQYTISVCLILGALVIWKQLKYFNHRNSDSINIKNHHPAFTGIPEYRNELYVTEK
jgi:putative ABC transport system permease protein